MKHCNIALRCTAPHTCTFQQSVPINFEIQFYRIEYIRNKRTHFSTTTLNRAKTSEVEPAVQKSSRSSNLHVKPALRRAQGFYYPNLQRFYCFCCLISLADLVRKMLVTGEIKITKSCKRGQLRAHRTKWNILYLCTVCIQTVRSKSSSEKSHIRRNQSELVVREISTNYITELRDIQTATCTIAIYEIVSYIVESGSLS